MKFFHDTNALIEILKGNPNYKKYLSFPINTLNMNLAELFCALLHEFGGDTASNVIDLLNIRYIEIPPGLENTIFQFQEKYRDKKFTRPDLVGYHVAKSKGWKFLTSDVNFKGMPNVEFVS